MDIAHALTVESHARHFNLLRDTLARLTEADPAWLLRLMSHQVADVLTTLETAVAQRVVPWGTLWLESHLYPLEEDWWRRPATAGVQLARIPKELSSLAPEMADLTAQLASLPDRLHPPFDAAPRLRCFPHDLLAVLMVLPEEELAALSAYLRQPIAPPPNGSRSAASGAEIPRDAEEVDPVVTLPGWLAYSEIPHLAMNQQVDSDEGQVALSVRFYPLLLDVETRQIFYPTLVEMHLRGFDPAGWTEEEVGTFWQWLRKAVQDQILALSHRDDAESQGAASESRSPSQSPARTDAAVPPPLIRPPFYVAFGPAPQSDLARQIVGAAYPVQLPSRWSSLKLWEEIRAAEVARLLATEGEESRHLRRQTRPDGAVTYDLKGDVERDLKVRASLRAGYIDQDEFGREYLVRTFEAGSGYLEIGLSWSGMAGPLVTDWVEAARRQAEGTPPQMRFEDLSEERQAEVDRRMSQVRIWENGRRVMEMILGQVGRQRRNPVEIPAEAFRVLLWPSLAKSRAWPRNWKRDVEGILEGLRAVTFRYHAHRTGDLKGKGMGSFIGEWSYVPRGKGRHGSGVYVLDVQRGFLGSLFVFISGRSQLRSGREVFVFDFEKELTREERLALGWEEGDARGDAYTIADASRPFVTAALGLTPQQENVLSWLDEELTRRSDPLRPGRTERRLSERDPEAQAPRLYDHSFCPLIPPGVAYAGVLGRRVSHPEGGFTLGGTRRQQGEGLLARVGYLLPRGRSYTRRRTILQHALGDLRTVIEEHLEGLVAGQLDTAWLSFDRLTELEPGELAHQLRLFCFVPADYGARLVQKWEVTTGYGAVTDADEAERHYWASPSGIPFSRDGEPVVPTIDLARLHHRLLDTMHERNLRQKDLAALFGVSPVTISYWLQGSEPDDTGKVRGRPIPEEVVPLVVRWIEEGVAPTADALAALTSRRPGRRRAAPGS